MSELSKELLTARIALLDSDTVMIDNPFTRHELLAAYNMALRAIAPTAPDSEAARLLTELAGALRPTYSMSPEGRAYLVRIDAFLSRQPGAREGTAIYVASRVKQAPVWEAYRRRGFPIISTWLNETGDGDTEDFGELWARIESEIWRCTALVFYAAGPDDFPFKGAFIEVGMALAMNKPVYAVLENVELEGRTMRPVGSWILDRRVRRIDSLEAAMRLAHSPAPAEGGA